MRAQRRCDCSRALWVPGPLARSLALPPPPPARPLPTLHPHARSQVRRLVDRDRKELNLDELEAAFGADPSAATPTSAAAADEQGSVDAASTRRLQIDSSQAKGARGLGGWHLLALSLAGAPHGQDGMAAAWRRLASEPACLRSLPCAARSAVNQPVSPFGPASAKPAPRQAPAGSSPFGSGGAAAKRPFAEPAGLSPNMPMPKPVGRAGGRGPGYSIAASQPACSSQPAPPPPAPACPHPLPRPGLPLARAGRDAVVDAHHADPDCDCGLVHHHHRLHDWHLLLCAGHWSHPLQRPVERGCPKRAAGRASRPAPPPRRSLLALPLLCADCGCMPSLTLHGLGRCKE